MTIIMRRHFPLRVFNGLQQMRWKENVSKKKEKWNADSFPVPYDMIF